ncbi:MAG: 4Fe-4S binding protein [Deltaproteobacteria bacterium]|nr:4Fe-4S binding protein [Deltaproteobacteria bacterium]
MSDEIYKKLAKVLDTLPSGFPATENGVEIKLLQKIFTPEEADLFCDLKLSPETAEQISSRTGRALDGLEEMLTSMWNRGEIWGLDVGGIKTFKMIPWIVGIWEYQIDRMDQEFAEMSEEYKMHVGPPLIMAKPEIMQVIPVEKQVPVEHKPLPYQQMTAIIESSQSFAVNECVCNKEKKLLGQGCDKPKEICMGLSQEPNAYDNHPWGRPITREEAYQILDKAEEAALVHLSTNVEKGHWFICNCCKCCCPVLGALTMFESAEHVNSSYYAVIDHDKCSACGVCADERCQVNAIEDNDEEYNIIRTKCIGCGLCISTCPEEAIELIRKSEDQITKPAKDDDFWFEERGRQRGVDFSMYK